MLDTRCLSPDFCIMKLEYGAQSELRCRHHRVKFVYVHVPFPLSLAANGGAENAGKCEEEKKVGKGTTQLWRGNVLRFSHFFFFASLWLSALCFSWQIASDIKFIYAKFARRALSYCPSTKR